MKSQMLLKKLIKFIVTHNKGGVGKTTVCKNKAEYCALVLNKRVLLVDLDSQCNLSSLYISMIRDSKTDHPIKPAMHPCYFPKDYPNMEGYKVTNGLKGKDEVILWEGPNNPNWNKWVNEEVYPGWDGYSHSGEIYRYFEAEPYPTRYENIDIIPADATELEDIVLHSKDEIEEKVIYLLQEFFQEKFADRYDIIIIDTPPSKGPLTKSAFRAATHMLIPTQLEQMSIDGLTGITSLLDAENSLRTSEDKLEIVGILANMYNPSWSLHRSFLDQLRNTKGLMEYVMDVELRRLQPIAEIATQPGSSVFDYRRSNAARNSVEEVCLAIGVTIWGSDDPAIKKQIELMAEIATKKKLAAEKRAAAKKIKQLTNNTDAQFNETVK